MIDDSPRIPPFGVLAATLRKTTEHLARELAQPSPSPPDWSALEWAIARSTAAMHGISALLANTLRWSGPPIWQTFLADQLEQSRLRHAGIGALLARLDAATRAAQVGCVTLKGSALRALELYRPGERPMSDIDLLVETRDLDAIGSVLMTLDYVLAFDTRRHTVYEPRRKLPLRGFGEHVDHPVNIEVHTAVAEPLPVHKVDITSRLRPGRPLAGLNAYPTLAALMEHLLLHAAGNMRAHALRQIQLHDISALARGFETGDWSALLAQPRDRDRPWWMFPALALAERYYPRSIPSEVLQEARAACPSMLRRAADRQTLTDVSWSNLRIPAFPGIAWSRTPLEALRFIRSRVLPTHVALAELAFARHTQPQLYQVPWYGVSHGNRILRWLLSRPPRVQTLVSVKAALESARAPRD